MTSRPESIPAGMHDSTASTWHAQEHPFSGLSTGDAGLRAPSEKQAHATADNALPIGAGSVSIASNVPFRLAAENSKPQTVDTPAAPGGSSQGLDIPPLFAPATDAPGADLPAPIQQAIHNGTPIRFSSPGENQQANRQPDYIMNDDGKLVKNPAATPSPDGSITIELQTKNAENNKSLRDAITHESEMQRAAAKDMIRYFQKAHPGQPVPSWMQDLAESKPNLPDFVPFPPAENSQPTPPPENGFSNRGVSGGGGDGGASGFSGNGGFDGNGYFRGNGGSGDGSIGTGERGAPLGPGEQVQAKQLYDYFVEKGFTPAQASGILGNIQTESSFKTNAYNSGEGAIGLCQWEGGRRTELENFARQEGKPVTDWHVQADFIMHELTHSESGAYQAIKAAQTPEQAAQAFQSRYERSASLGNRAANASNIYHQLA